MLLVKRCNNTQRCDKLIFMRLSFALSKTRNTKYIKTHEKVTEINFKVVKVNYFH